MRYIHASCVSVNDRGVLILGESGTGKSDLALRLINKGATLVADDRVGLNTEGDVLIASPHIDIAGMLEVRQLGIARLPYRAFSEVKMAVTLVESSQTERIPEGDAFAFIEKIKIPMFYFHSFWSSTPDKVLMALDNLLI